MAYTREEFQAGEVNLTIPIRQILERRPDLTYNAEEIRELLADTMARISSQEEVVSALEQMVSEGRALARDFAGDRWYTVTEPEKRRELGFLARRS